MHTGEAERVIGTARSRRGRVDGLDPGGQSHRRGLRRYLAAAVLVRLADEGARVGLVLLALDRTGSAGVGGLLVAALLIPHVVAAPAVGWLTDRAHRPRVVLAVAALGFSAGLAAAAMLLGRTPLWLVVVTLLVAGCCGPALTGALTSQLAQLVPVDQLPRTYGADSLTYNVSGIAGPAIAGTIAGIWSPAAATLVLAAAAAAGGLVLTFMPLASRRRETSTTETPAPSLTTGFRAIITDRVLRTVTVASSLGQLGPGALAVVAAVLAEQQGQTAATGWLLTAVAVGGLVGSLWWTWRPAAPAHAARTVMFALIGVGAPLAVAAATTHSLVCTAVLFAVSGVFLGPFTGALFTTRQDHAPAEAQAQVFTISAGLKTTTAAAGAAIGGAIAGIAVPTQLLLVGATPVIAGILGGLAFTLQRRPNGNR